MIGFESSGSRAWSEDREDRRERRERCARPGGVLLPLRVMGFGLAVVPFLLRGRLERLAERLESAAGVTGRTLRYEPRTAEELSRRIDFWLRAGWPLIRRGCLTRGITQLWFLRRAGFPVSLRFGIGEITGDPIDGHCWLVLDGEPFAEKRDPRPLYTETWRIPRV
jgi:Transglutaminase-like superfamily